MFLIIITLTLLAGFTMYGLVSMIKDTNRREVKIMQLKNKHMLNAEQVDIHYEVDKDGDFSLSCPFVLNDCKIGSFTCYRCIHNRGIDNRRRCVYCAHPEQVKLLK